MELHQSWVGTLSVLAKDLAESLQPRSFASTQPLAAATYRFSGRRVRGGSNPSSFNCSISAAVRRREGRDEDWAGSVLCAAVTGQKNHAEQAAQSPAHSAAVSTEKDPESRNSYKRESPGITGQ
jgi:hypothetical protein